MTDAASIPRPQLCPTAPVAIVATALALDQAMKGLMVLVVMQPPQEIPIVPGFNLVLGFREGSSFGMLSGVMAGNPQLMAALTGLLTVILAVMAFRARHPFGKAGLALIVGGAEATSSTGCGRAP